MIRLELGNDNANYHKQTVNRCHGRKIIRTPRRRNRDYHEIRGR